VFFADSSIFADTAHFCGVVTRHFADSSNFADVAYFVDSTNDQMCTLEFSTASNRLCKHNGKSARPWRCRQKPDAAQSPHTVNRRSATGQRSKYVVDRRSRYENRTSRFNKYYCNSEFSTLIITLSLTLTLMWACLLDQITAKWAWSSAPRAWPEGGRGLEVTWQLSTNQKFRPQNCQYLTTQPSSCPLYL